MVEAKKAKQSKPSREAADVSNVTKTPQRRNKSKDARKKKGVAAKRKPAGPKVDPTAVLRDLEKNLRFPGLHADSSLLHVTSKKELGPPEDIIEYLHEDVNQRGYYAQTPLHLTCLQPNHSLTSLLLAYGADPTLASTGGTTALHNAVAKGGAVQVACLLQNRPALDVDVEDGAGWRPLHIAAMCASDLATVELLLERKANVNAANRHMNGDTPLHMACRSHHACVEMLLDAKADATLRTANGNTPIHLLVSHCARTKLPAIDSKVLSLASIAPEEAVHAAIIRHLLESKASADTRNMANLRPVDVAKSEYGKRLLGALVVELPDRWGGTFRLDTVKPLYKM